MAGVLATKKGDCAGDISTEDQVQIPAASPKRLSCENRPIFIVSMLNESNTEFALYHRGKRGLSFNNNVAEFSRWFWCQD
jgi:hypothetical protein